MGISLYVSWKCAGSVNWAGRRLLRWEFEFRCDPLNDIVQWLYQCRDLSPRSVVLWWFGCGCILREGNYLRGEEYNRCSLPDFVIAVKLVWISLWAQLVECWMWSTETRFVTHKGPASPWRTKIIHLLSSYFSIVLQGPYFFYRESRLIFTPRNVPRMC